jgi:hypothetical protein
LRCLSGDNERRSGLLQLSFLAPLRLDISKISEERGVVNKVGGVVGIEPPSENQKNWGLNLLIFTGKRRAISH